MQNFTVSVAAQSLKLSRKEALFLANSLIAALGRSTKRTDFSVQGDAGLITVAAEPVATAMPSGAQLTDC